ncbi:mannose-6-phosphate isomerase class I [Labedella gwakjiensis]|uniref:Mannose-6-phosphate isomerase n=1 Tax=Labedella gwakjiensis TaxID=390269 RepID=A0A2P8GW78_9MICO|nr:class I mannose-6-phosphate isomerase [Labedella gwakjiensis]PSL38218.1 mannose-6-phosphate isomerase class I [Labedella gwakjiensis]RUQ87241.1 mannose-6-phosphate isomerase [Labedella gwakjiensis]
MASHPSARRRSPAYDPRPTIPLPGEHRVDRGSAVWARLATTLPDGGTIAIDTYPGTDLPGLRAALAEHLPDAVVIDIEDAAALPAERIDALIAGNLTDDRVFGVMSHHTLSDFYDPAELDRVAARVEAAPGLRIVVGWGATLAPVLYDVVVLADLARWEIQKRQRAGAPNWRADNGHEDAIRKVKRGFFVDWRVADRHKRGLFDRLDFVLDTNDSVDDARLLPAEAFHAALELAVTRPFRVVPFFDPGVWGGQWMKENLGIDSDDNLAWCFDCVPEENSLLVEAGGEIVEIPSIDLVFRHPRALLGERTFARFGAEFPIRFDMLDTMGGGNLSLQVHPLTDYIQNTFGMHYTQDESYYLLDASDDAVVYLGVKTDVDRSAMIADLHTAAAGTADFPAERYVNTFPARKHDHFLIPAGTVHCSGADSMVLEISATPYIFTFKMHDWGRVGLDGVPRPIHLEHAAANIQWDRDTEWTERNLVDRVERLAEGPGWIEERTGLHELEFIDVRRHWFTDVVPHHTRGTVNVLNLVEGDEAIIESPTGAFEPWVVHYAETFIVPAAVGAYTIRPHGPSIGRRLATVKAFVAGT